MLHLNSFNLLNNNDICKSLQKSAQRKVKKRLKDFNDLLVFGSKNNIQSSNSAFNLANHAEKIIATHWNVNFDALNIILSNGLIAWFFFDEFDYTSLTYIYLDKYLVGKIQTLHVVDVIFHPNKILFSYTNSSITCVQISDIHNSSLLKLKKNFKLKFRNVKIVEFNLEINSSVRKVEKHLLLDNFHNNEETLLCVWWQNGFNSLCPWSSPISSSKDFSNVFIYNIFKNNFELIGFDSIPNTILKISFSKTKSYQLMTVEDEQKPKTLAFKIYQLSDFDYECNLNLVICRNIAIPSHFLKVEFNLSLDKVLILCEGKTIILFNINQNSTLFFTAPINAVEIVVNPFDSFFVISDNSGQIMMYDFGLHVISANYDDLFMREAFGCLSSIEFLNGFLLCLKFKEISSLILITLPNNLNYVRLINAYVKNAYINEALENLQSLDWNINSYLAYSSLAIIFNHLIKEPLNPIKESQLQLTLACFYNPIIPIDEEIVSEYQDVIHSLAKKFFFHLYRYSCLEKAFLLALDLNSRHLFLLLYKIAKERGNIKLASVSFQHVARLNNNLANTFNFNDLQLTDQICPLNKTKAVPYFSSKLNNNLIKLDQSNQHNLWQSIDKNEQHNSMLKSLNQKIDDQFLIHSLSNNENNNENSSQKSLIKCNHSKNFSLNGTNYDLAPSYLINYENSDFSFHYHLPYNLKNQNMFINSVPSNLTIVQQKEQPSISHFSNKSSSFEPPPLIPPKSFNSKRTPPPLPPKVIHTFFPTNDNQSSNITLPIYDVNTLQNDYLTLLPMEIGNNLNSTTSILKLSPNLSENVSGSSNAMSTQIIKDEVKKDNLKIECIHFGIV